MRASSTLVQRSLTVNGLSSRTGPRGALANFAAVLSSFEPYLRWIRF